MYLRGITYCSKTLLPMAYKTTINVKDKAQLWSHFLDQCTLFLIHNIVVFRRRKGLSKRTQFIARSVILEPWIMNSEKVILSMLEHVQNGRYSFLYCHIDEAYGLRWLCIIFRPRFDLTGRRFSPQEYRFLFKCLQSNKTINSLRQEPTKVYSFMDKHCC